MLDDVDVNVEPGASDDGDDDDDDNDDDNDDDDGACEGLEMKSRWDGTCCQMTYPRLLLADSIVERTNLISLTSDDSDDCDRDDSKVSK